MPTPSAALRWDSKGVSFVPSDGLETKGISINNLGGVLINGYFDGGSSRAPAVVDTDGLVTVLEVPAGLFGGAAPNPANVLAALLASLHDADGRVTVPGFYDDVVELLPENPDHAPIVLDTRQDEFAVEGLGVGLIRAGQAL